MLCVYVLLEYLPAVAYHTLFTPCYTMHRLFDPCSLEYRVTIPKPHPLGVNIATALDSR